MAKIEIDLLDTSLDNSGDGDHEILGMVDDGSFGSGGDEKGHMAKFMDSGEDDISYNYKNPGSTVTYRLVHVGGDEGGGGVSSAPAHYSPNSVGSDPGNAQSLHTVLANSVNGQLYVIGNSEVFGENSNKPIIPRETHGKGPSMKKRDDRRRMTHNEVERRRRDKINNWIIKLAKLMPHSVDTGEKCNGEVQSKGGILAKACEYITELKYNEQRLDEVTEDKNRLTNELVVLSMQVSSLKRSNTLLRNQLSQNGIVPNSEAPDVS